MLLMCFVPAFGDDRGGVGAGNVGERRGHVLNVALGVDGGCRCHVL